jgi:protein-L-isoaspartate O-methyltransferase
MRTGSALTAPVGAVAPLTPNAWLRYDVIQRMLPPGVGDVLEVGCGQGALGVRLAQRFDLVCAFEVLEHIEDDAAALAALLAAGGGTGIVLRQYGWPLGYLLEAARNVIAQRRLAAAGTRSAAERTAASGRLLQPAGRARAAAIQYGTAPFRVPQRAFPDTGPGLVALAQVAG